MTTVFAIAMPCSKYHIDESAINCFTSFKEAKLEALRYAEQDENTLPDGDWEFFPNILTSGAFRLKFIQHIAKKEFVFYAWVYPITLDVSGYEATRYEWPSE